MSIGEVHARINQIQSMMLVASTGTAPAATKTAAPVSGTASGASAKTGTATSASRFAAALDAAVAADRPSTVAAPPARTPGETWVRPTQGRVTSGFGPRWGTEHEGLDIAAGTGTPVRAVTDGVVKKASWYGGYGNAVIIDHGNGLKTLYGHNSKLTVKPGDRVQAGEVIAKMGSTGDSTGPHLHFEVEVNGKKINPQPWLKRRGITF